MRWIWRAAALPFVIAVAPAQAADLRTPMAVKPEPVAPAYNWTGLYVGAHLGYGWGRTTYTDPTLPGWSVLNKPDGVLAGGQVGYNWQSGPLVFGAEADLSWTAIKGTALDVAPFAGDRYEDRFGWMATLTGRAGYAVDRTLFYVKGGAAFADARHEYQWIGTSAVATGDRRRSGWTIGGGVEHAVGPGWSVRLDYGYADFGKRPVDLVEPSYAWVADVSQAVHLVKLGINVRLLP